MGGYFPQVLTVGSTEPGAARTGQLWLDTAALTRWVNVGDYGAAGDGTTNDTAAIAAAVSDAADEGLVLFFPAGTFITDPVSLAGVAGVVGSGPAATIIKLRAQNVGTLGDHGLLELYGTSGNEITRFFARDFTLDGNTSNMTGTKTANMECFDLKYVDRSHFSNIHCINGISEGFDLDHCEDNVIEGCVARSCGGNGFHMSNGAIANRLIGNLAENCGKGGNSRHGFDQYNGSSPEANRNVFVGNVARDCYRNYGINGSTATFIGNASLGSPTVTNSFTATMKTGASGDL